MSDEHHERLSKNRSFSTDFVFTDNNEKYWSVMVDDAIECPRFILSGYIQYCTMYT